ncbi:MAG: hypothetical protein IT304_09230 [Dehalococcoidia bacterium]|nr:hypothetical protein [Dehalococcoidia bacterium]
MAEWTARWLRGGCGPGGHTLIAVADNEGAGLRCTRCQRRENTAGTSCLVCNNTGVVPAALRRGEEATVIDGLLCRACAAELMDEGEVEEWRGSTPVAGRQPRGRGL